MSLKSWWIWFFKLSFDEKMVICEKKNSIQFNGDYDSIWIDSLNIIDDRIKVSFMYKERRKVDVINNAS